MKYMGKESISGRIEKSIKECGKKTKCTVKEFCAGQMVKSTLAILRMIKETEKDNFVGKMDENMKDFG
jgi:hypothetical protein